MKTYMAKGETVERKWYVVDAEGMVLGRLASQVAAILRGKHKPIYTPHVDTGDHVIIVNADKVTMTGNKLDQKKYYRHTGYPGGLRETSYRDLLEKKPEFAVYEAIRRMMPKGPLGRKMLKKVRIYAGTEHQHTAQVPETLVLK
ncbi:50S ribosomal protein L13 [bioreactor metagenome]|uniref:50S ribosomal protein L13 n=1 Tax=bioreactor metagenome TaxID=1076179 RepID=A0A645F2P9_9ZZZZ|nr:50S ribosomal protein L13 [Candidatus Pelethousia sp.]NCB30927.1 50S ribosomal protein L13 [Clostridia bacterium]